MFDLYMKSSNYTVHILHIDPYSKVEGPHRQEQISQQIYGKQINSELCHLEEECGEVG